MNYKWANWEETSSMTGIDERKCDRCKNIATKIAVAEEGSPFFEDIEIIKSLCEKHYNKSTQKKWLKKWRNKNLNYN